MRYEYFEIFYLNPDGTVSSDFSIRIKGITMSPGTRFKPGSPIGGLDVAGSLGKDIKATLHDQTVFVIEKFC